MFYLKTLCRLQRLCKGGYRRLRPCYIMRYSFFICLDGLSKTTKHLRIYIPRSEILTRDLLSREIMTSLRCNHALDECSCIGKQDNCE